MSEEVKEKKDEATKDKEVEEDEKEELINAIKELKPEEANSNIKAKLLQLGSLHFNLKDIYDDKYGVEYDKLQDKYDSQYIDIYQEIEDICNNKKAVEISEEEKEKYNIQNSDNEENKAIEDYWYKVILNSRYFDINEKDKKILKYLKSVKFIKFKDNVNNFKIDFTFESNEYFSPDTLSKMYEFDKKSILKKATATPIEWVSKDKNPTIEVTTKKIKKGKKFVHEKKENHVNSFFDFFGNTEDMTFLEDEITFFKEDLFFNQLEYYLDIVSSVKHEKDKDIEEEEDEDNDDNPEQNGKKKEECKQQ